MKRPEPGGSNLIGKVMEVSLANRLRTQLESIGNPMNLPARITNTLDQALGSIEAQIQSSWGSLIQQVKVPPTLDLELQFYIDPAPSFDPADILIARSLKDWIEEEDIPVWVRAQVLGNATQPSITSSWAFVLRMTLKWVLSSGLGLISLLISDEPLIFGPSSDNYCLNPPHLSPCIVHARVRDTFLLEAGLYGVIG
jgi:hypothetical protein